MTAVALTVTSMFKEDRKGGSKACLFLRSGKQNLSQKPVKDFCFPLREFRHMAAHKGSEITSHTVLGGKNHNMRNQCLEYIKNFYTSIKIRYTTQWENRPKM